MYIDIEKVRAWIKGCSLEKREAISEAADYPYHSLNKFAIGTVIDPGFTRVQRLAQIMERHGESPADTSDKAVAQA